MKTKLLIEENEKKEKLQADWIKPKTNKLTLQQSLEQSEESKKLIFFIATGELFQIIAKSC